MACFLVPAAEAVVTTVAAKIMEKKELASETSVNVEAEAQTKIPFTRKLKWLSNMLWGGSALLAFEHLWHGEITPWFPFLTAASDPVTRGEMFHEMLTAGVSMAVLVTAVWVGIVAVTSAMEKREAKRLQAEAE